MHSLYEQGFPFRDARLVGYTSSENEPFGEIASEFRAVELSPRTATEQRLATVLQHLGQILLSFNGQRSNDSSHPQPTSLFIRIRDLFRQRGRDGRNVAQSNDPVPLPPVIDHSSADSPDEFTETEDVISVDVAGIQAAHKLLETVLPTYIVNSLSNTLDSSDIQRLAKLVNKYGHRLNGVTELAMSAATRPDGSMVALLDELNAMPIEQRRDQLTSFLPNIPESNREAAFRDLQGMSNYERGPLFRLVAVIRPVSLDLPQEAVRAYRAQLLTEPDRTEFDRIGCKTQRFYMKVLTPQEFTEVLTHVRTERGRITELSNESLVAAAKKLRAETAWVCLAADSLNLTVAQAAGRLKQDRSILDRVSSAALVRSNYRLAGLAGPTTDEIDHPAEMIDRVIAAAPSESLLVIWQKMIRAGHFHGG